MSESAVIGALLADSSGWDVAAEILTTDDFTDRTMRALWIDISAMVKAGEPVDTWTVRAKGYDLGILGDAQAGISPSIIRSYSLAVRREAQRRQAVAVLSDSHGRLINGQPVPDVLADTSASLEAINEDRGGNFYDTASAKQAALVALKEAADARNSDGVAGVPTGLDIINRISSGWRERRLYVIAARPSVGKTSLAMQCAYHAAHKGFPVGVIELEMDAQDLVTRALASKTGTLYWDLTVGKPGALERVAHVDLPDGVLIDDTTRHINQIVARASQWRRTEGIRALFVDHLGLIKGGNEKQSRARQLGDISFELKTLAKRLNIPVILLCQLNRNVETQNREPTLSDLRDSGEIEENADAALFLHCRDKEPSQRKVEIAALKNRMGTVGWSTRHAVFDASIQRWTEPRW